MYVYSGHALSFTKLVHRHAAPDPFGLQLYILAVTRHISTLFSVAGNVAKHRLSCLLYSQIVKCMFIVVMHLATPS